jgi:hypothetical protein
MTDQNILIPEVSDGAEIFPGRFWIISPEETTNLLKNPSVETAITGYTALNSTIARSVVLGHQRRGLYGIDITPQANIVAGLRYATDTVLTVGQTYTFSCDVFGIHNNEYRVLVTDVLGSRISPYVKWLGRGEWKRVSVTWTETSPVTRWLYLVRQPSLETDPFFTDGWQLEALKYPTTYTDGDQLGLTPGELAYGWNGPVHASTSYRISDTRAGGREMPIAGTGDGVKIMAVVGLGEPPVENFATELNIGGAMYLNSVYKPRNFSLAGSMQSLSGMNQLLEQRAELRSLTSILSTTRRQPMKLRYRTYDAVNCELGGRAYDIVCCYVGGLEGNITNPDQERITMNFIEYDPGIREDGETAVEIPPFELVDNADAFVWKEKRTGVYGTLPTVANGAVYAMLELPDGRLIIAGAFTTLNGTAANRICIYDPGTGGVTALGVGLNGTCYALALDASGNLLVGGANTQAGGATCNGIAKWTFSTSTWSVYNIGASIGVHGGTATVYTIAAAPDGTFYIGGNHTDFVGVANTGYLSHWTGATSVAMGTGANGIVRCMVWNIQKSKIFIGGAFTSMSGSATYGNSRWNHSALTWDAAAVTIGLPAPGVSWDVTSMAITSAGLLYAKFFDGAGVTATYTWSGAAWAFNSTNSGIFSFDPYDNLMLAGNYQVIGSSWLAVDVAITGILCVLATRSRVYWGCASAVLKYQGKKLTVLPITGNEFFRPVIKVFNRVIPAWFRNFPNGSLISTNTLVSTTETITIDTNNQSVVSSFSGNWMRNLLPGSSMYNWLITKKTNKFISQLLLGYTVYNDGANQLDLTLQQRITGLTFANTDTNHTVYVTIVDDGGGFRHADIYKASARAAGDLIAHTATYNSTGYKALIADNASGVGGYLNIAVVGAADADIYMVCPYLYMGWQNKYMSIDDVL